VATAFTLRLHELSSMTLLLLLWPPEAGAEILRAYRDFMAEAPDEVGGAAFFFTGPAEAFVPASLHGTLAFGFALIYAGPEAEARRVTAPMLRLGHTGELIVEVPYAELQCMFEDPPGYRNYWSAEHLTTFPDEAIDRFCARAQEMIVPSPSQLPLLPGGGAVARATADYPIPWRNVAWTVHPFGVWSDPADDERGRRWVRDIRADLQPWASGAVYLNFTGDEGEERVIAGFGRENYARLAKVKAQYDPENIFHLNHNIKPAVRQHPGL
jgi:FAD/FMN-containing dehydrogenase